MRIRIFEIRIDSITFDSRNATAAAAATCGKQDRKVKVSKGDADACRSRSPFAARQTGSDMREILGALQSDDEHEQAAELAYDAR